eukprot:gene18562-22208_t
MSHDSQQKQIERNEPMPNHPHICKTFVSSQYRDDELHLFVVVMELVDGANLLDIIIEYNKVHQYEFQEQTAKIIVYQLVQAVMHMHESHISHRDIKPENIIVRMQGQKCEVKLIDFGLSKKLPFMAYHTPCGTPEYVAPEILYDLPYTKMINWKIAFCTTK